MKKTQKMRSIIPLVGIYLFFIYSPLAVAVCKDPPCIADKEPDEGTTPTPPSTQTPPATTPAPPPTTTSSGRPADEQSLIDKLLANGFITDSDKAKQCYFEVNQNVLNNTYAYIKSLRAMEWLFATNTNDGVKYDCLGLASPYLKNKFGVPLSTARLDAVKKFNEEKRKIDADAKTILEAKADSKGYVSFQSILGSRVPEKAVAESKATNYYGYQLMLNRNELFKAYETRLRDILVAGRQPIIDARDFVLNTDLDSGAEDANGWRIGDQIRTPSAVNCRNELAFPDRLFDMWSQRIEVRKFEENYSPFRSMNGTTVVDSKVTDYLDSILPKFSQQYFKTGVGSAFAPKLVLVGLDAFYLLDPIIPGGMSFLSFGTPGLGAFNSNERFRFFENASTPNPKNLDELKKKFIEKIIEYYKSSKPSGVTDYVPETELIIPINDPDKTGTFNGNDCLATMNSELNVTGVCEPVANFIREIADISFAQFIAYSYSPNSFLNSTRSPWHLWFQFGEEGTRGQLMNHYEDVMDFLIPYYDNLKDLRELQTMCLKRVISSLVTTHMSNDDSGSVFEDTNYYSGDYDGTKEEVGGSNGRSGTREGNKERNRNSSTPIVPKVSTIAVNAYLDKFGVDKNKNGKANVAFSNAMSSMSARQAARLKLNKDSASSLAARDRVKENLAKSFGSQFSASGSKTGSAISSSGIGALNAANLGLVGNKNNPTSDTDKNSDKSKNVNGVSSSAATSDNTKAGYNPLSGVGGVSSSANSSEVANPTGLNELDRNHVMANLDKNKSQFNPNENDSLFGVVSKAYMRNLDKFLKKKKEIKE